jgi:hypothetical protein
MPNEFVTNGTQFIFSQTSMTEAATYYPNGNLGSGKSIRVVTEREMIAPLEYAEYTAGTTVIVEVANDATLGVTSVNENKDLIDIVLVEGKVASRCLVNSVVQSDPGVFRLYCTA